MNDRTRIRIGITVGALAGSLVSATMAANATSGSSSTAAATNQPPPRVAVVSKALDVFETGASVGPGVMNGIINSAVDSQPFPPPADQVQQAVIKLAGAITSQMSTQGPAGIEALRKVVAPLACANPELDAGIAALANGLDNGASSLSQLIQPFDVTAHETATLLRNFSAPRAC